MLSFYERRAEECAVGRKNAEPSGWNAVFYERRAEDSAIGRKNAGPSVSNAVFL
jgi:hypothetical protein